MIQLVSFLVAVFLPRAVIRDYGPLLLFVWFGANLWWFDRSSEGYFREVEAWRARRSEETGED